MTRKTSRTTEQKDPDFQSFAKIKNEINDRRLKERCGKATILSLKEEEPINRSHERIPSSYNNSYDIFRFDEYVIFDAILSGTDEHIDLVVPVRYKDKDILDPTPEEYNMMLEWVDADEIDDVAGRRVPIKEVENDIYRVQSFTNTMITSLFGVNTIKKMIDYGLISYSNGEWCPSTRYKTARLVIILSIVIPLLALV
jgi:hypothetical protein